MNIVFLSPESVYPVNTGGRIVVFNRIKYLHDLGHRIFLLCVVDSDEEIAPQKAEMEKYCYLAGYYNRNRLGVRKYFNSVLYPFAVGSRTLNDIQRDLNDILVQNKIDLIMCEFPQMAGNLKHIRKSGTTKVILSQHNIESNSMLSLSKGFSNPVKRFIYSFDAHRFRIFEKNIYKKALFDAYIFVSDDDMEFFRNNYEYGSKPTKLVPIGAEDHGSVVRKPSDNVIIVGKMSYAPNVDGVMWFYENVWPKVRMSNPKAKLFIVGKEPDERIRNIVDDSVNVTGTVDSVEPYYINGAVAAVPLFTGGGVKTKLIEAASYRIPIVCTISGATGTEFKDKKHLYISDDSDEFAMDVIEALNNGPEVMAKVEEAYSLFENRYTWKGICKDLSTFLIELMEN